MMHSAKVKLLQVAMLLTGLWGMPLAAHASVESDMLAYAATEAYKAGDYQKASEKFEELGRLGVSLPDSFLYFHGAAALAASGIARKKDPKCDESSSEWCERTANNAYQLLHQYASQVGREGRYYRDAIRLMDNENLKKWRDAYQERVQEFRRNMQRAKVELKEWNRLTADEKFAELGLVYIPSGTFQMGSRNKRWRDNAPKHKVKVKGFWLGKFELTNRFIRLYMAAHKDSYDLDTSDDILYNVVDAFSHELSNHPFVGSPEKIIPWLKQETGRDLRLPSEAEWEYAAIASHRKLTFSPNEANIESPRFSAVGHYPPNKFGLYDMIGNVAEVVQDCWHDNYKGAPKDGSAWVTGCYGSSLVARGGGSKIKGDSDLQKIRIYAYRKAGFRLAMDASEEELKAEEELKTHESHKKAVGGNGQ